MNHNVQVCIKGCLTLKLSASWKTVRMESGSKAASMLALLASPFPPSGEMGIVSKGTGELLTTAAMSPMFAVVVDPEEIARKRNNCIERVSEKECRSVL